MDRAKPKDLTFLARSRHRSISGKNGKNKPKIVHRVGKEDKLIKDHRWRRIQACLYTCILIYLSVTCVSGTTTIRVSRKTLQALERLRDKFAAESLDEAIQSLIRKQRQTIIANVFGLDKSKVKRFTERDRGEDRC